ncbi:lipase maturation factor family protein [Streptomyces sp. NPDC047725]|uniref:lipase maturation factor family protein n=1 Tax=Streptomyces sp. NPDC047725 TaxID=3365487 RepID=UPI003716B515
MIVTRPWLIASGNLAWLNWLTIVLTLKPGGSRRLPPQVAPCQPRPDWMKWFAAVPPASAGPRLPTFLGALGDGDRAVLRLLRGNPFSDAPPISVRARLHQYRFTSRHRLRATGSWRDRTLVGESHPSPKPPRRGTPAFP